jgi:2-isopropylmalate synthase
MAAEIPVLKLFLLPGERVRPLVVVLPGGGYSCRAPHEADPVAQWLNGLGLHAAVCHYRVFPWQHPLPLADAQRAVRLVRANAAEWRVDPERVGNEMRSVTSELSGRGNIQLQARRLGFDLDNAAAQHVLAQIKHLEHEGFTFEAAEASVELMFHRLAADYLRPFELLDYFVITERRHGRGLLSEATVKVKLGEVVKFTAAEGNGPVNALATALQDALVEVYPVLRSVRLIDYKVRILAGTAGTAANTRVLIDFQSGVESWTTVGASPNIIDASWRALSDSMEYALMRLGGENQ